MDKVNVQVIKHVDYWKIPVSRTQYCYCDSEGDTHVVNHTYLSLDGQKTQKNITIKSGNGLFGLEYEDVYLTQSFPVERLIHYIDGMD